MISWSEYRNKMCFEQLQKAARIYDPFVERSMKDKFYSWSDYMQACAVDKEMLPEDPYAKEMCEWGYVYDFYNWKEATSSCDCSKPAVDCCMIRCEPVRESHAKRTVPQRRDACTKEPPGCVHELRSHTVAGLQNVPASRA